jgi:acetyl-CoA C-acetyltransferase
VGQVVQRDGERDAIGLMVAAAERAAEDAGDPALLARIGQVLVPEGMWSHGDAGRLVAARVGAPDARTLLARIGILQTTLFARAAAAIEAGEADVVLVTGGEARARFVAAQRAGADAEETPAPPDAADETLAPHGDIVSRAEIERGLALPAQSYAVQESAIRDVAGLHAMWARFSQVAAKNPHAWDPTAYDVGAIADPGAPGNRMVSSPYTKRHCSQWNVDVGAAILLCAVETADELGIAAGRRVHPIAVAESNAMITVSRRAELNRSPAFAIAGRRLAEVTGIAPAEVDHLELYSCFPSAVRIQAAELGIDLGRQLTVTGGMAFAGGPLNSAVLHSVATMVDVLRADPGSTGLVNAISGMITKQGMSVWSTEPRDGGFAFVDVSDATVAETAALDVDLDYAGAAVIDGATVAFDKQGPALAVVVATTPAGTRALATSADRGLAALLAADPGSAVGTTVTLDGPNLRHVAVP